MEPARGAGSSHKAPGQQEEPTRSPPSAARGATTKSRVMAAIAVLPAKGPLVPDSRCCALESSQASQNPEQKLAEEEEEAGENDHRNGAPRPGSPPKPQTWCEVDRQALKGQRRRRPRTQAKEEAAEGVEEDEEAAAEGKEAEAKEEQEGHEKKPCRSWGGAMPTGSR